MKKFKFYLPVWAGIKSNHAGATLLNVNKIPLLFSQINFMELSQHIDKHIEGKVKDPKKQYKPFLKYLEPDLYEEILRQVKFKVKTIRNERDLVILDNNHTHIMTFVKSFTNKENKEDEQ